MQVKRLASDGNRSWAIIMDIDDDPKSALEQFAQEHNVGAAHFTAIGAFRQATLAYFDWGTKEYKDIPIEEQVEVLTMAGDIAVKEGKPKVHAHLVVGRPDGTTRGGHLKSAKVRPTLEVMLTELPGSMQRKHDPTSGLALIDLNA